MSCVKNPPEDDIRRAHGWKSATRSLASRWRDSRRLLAPPAAGDDRAAPIEAFFGPLEIRVLESLWGDAHPEATVRDLKSEFSDIAYTTLMTTLDRLYKKGILDRRKRGRAYAYTARYTRAGLEAYLAQDAFDALLDGGSRAALRPLLSSFVEAVSRKDSELLDDLEALVRDKRSAGAADPSQHDGEEEG
jgi:predicted transcriptional regulator